MSLNVHITHASAPWNGKRGTVTVPEGSPNLTARQIGPGAIRRTLTWTGSLVLAAFYWIAVTACDQSYQIEVDTVQIAQGKVTGKARVDGKSREFEGIVGGDGKIEVDIEGFKIKGSFQPGSTFRVKQGGLIVMQVPVGVTAGTWRATNLHNGDTATVALTLKPPGRLLDSLGGGFRAEPGYSLLFGRLPRTFRDEEWHGYVEGQLDFDARAVGMHPIKMLIAGLLTATGAGERMTSEFIFPEYPMVHDFAMVLSPRNVFPLQLVDGSWKQISTPDALALGLPETASSTYLGLELKGAVEPDLNRSFIIEANGDTATGALLSTMMIGGRSTLVVAFDRADLERAVGVKKGSARATLTGSLASLRYGNRFSVEGDLKLDTELGVDERNAGMSSSWFELLPNRPNPVRSSTTIPYRPDRDAVVRLRVYDASGALVSTLVDRRETRGMHEVMLDAAGLPPGVYSIELSVGSSRTMRTMSVVR